MSKFDIKYVRSEDNIGDVMTKQLGRVILEKHLSGLCLSNEVQGSVGLDESMNLISYKEALVSDRKLRN